MQVLRSLVSLHLPWCNQKPDFSFVNIHSIHMHIIVLYNDLVFGLLFIIRNLLPPTLIYMFPRDANLKESKSGRSLILPF